MTEEYEKFVKNKQNKDRFSFKIFDRAKPVHVILLAVLFFVGTLIEKSNSQKWVYFVLAGLGVFFLFSVMKQAPEKKQIPRHLAQEIARQDLIREIDMDRIFIKGTDVIPTGYFRDQSWDDGEGPKLFKYHIGFKIRIPNRGEEEIIYQMNPFTGESKGIVEAPIGFWGQEIKDIQQIFPEKIIKEEKKE